MTRPWKHHVVPTLNDPAEGHVRCGSEYRLKGRFQERVGQRLVTIFDANGIDLSFDSLARHSASSSAKETCWGKA
ncbi:hypothetical protein N7519_007698 [Penicillium mononematosum]|uniref:uncharacterized protein n=1 Tax=Penicillium mononematosum TaxID=268346 RepID=UPI002546F94B|nr:uncharacterized protein N7519_007698 [Penicillium mononematosum]KAJ6186397.1 hypothetical protein N7519_007698 [Penicillium mononematosum]